MGTNSVFFVEIFFPKTTLVIEKCYFRYSSYREFNEKLFLSRTICATLRTHQYTTLRPY